MELFEDICSYQNLMLAFERVEDNAGTCGIDNVTIEEFSLDLEKRLIFLRRHLLDGTYVPDALLKVGMPEDNGKIRWLSIPTVRDRVAQTSAAMVLSPILDRDASDPQSEAHKVSLPSSSAIGYERNDEEDRAVCQPIPEKEQRGPAKETVPRSLEKEHDHRLPGMLDTVMAQAFREALDVLDVTEADAFFQEKPEIEPSSSGEPFLRTLYLLEQGVTLAKEDERFKVIREGEVIREIPVIK